MLSSTYGGDGPAELNLSVAATSVISMLRELSHRSRSTAVLRCEGLCARIDTAKIKRSKKWQKMMRYMGGRMETADFTRCKVKKMKPVKFKKEKKRRDIIKVSKIMSEPEDPTQISLFISHPYLLVSILLLLFPNLPNCILLSFPFPFSLLFLNPFTSFPPFLLSVPSFSCYK